ncbi:meiotic recombination protein REC114 isoform X5 [Synchiropus splendidus]|uniref:meiotic recombination protein REC114 isoform X5 n=1 Tax=Synchiropus splendidus TaxID=270530 RepID=UPI00237E0EFD|nr:meiotic recombination protein REC114 isoform X5 [Synchiropus splendidus]
MTDSVSWRLTRYGKYIPRTGEETSEQPDKLYESKRKDPEIVLTIVGSGYLLILQGQASLDTFHLTGSSDIIKVQHKLDTLVLRFALEGQSCLIRMQFDGRTRGVAIKECSSAVGKLKEYLPASSFDDAPVPLHQPPTEISPPPMQIQTSRPISCWSLRPCSVSLSTTWEKDLSYCLNCTIRRPLILVI